MSSTFVLPPDTCLEYLAEGAANIVYQIRLSPQVERRLTPPIEADLDLVAGHNPDSTTPPPSSITPPPPPLPPPGEYTPTPLRGYLLRLRKAVPWIAPYQSLHATQARLIAPLLPSNQLVAQHLALLPSSLLPRLNADLVNAEREGSRNAKRHGRYLATDEPHGLLVTDMAAQSGASHVCIEVKPKWLAQSPSAPPQAIRCRTCALRTMRAVAKSSLQGIEEDAQAFCPLDLVSGDRVGVSLALAALLAAASLTHQSGPHWLRSALVEYFLSDSPLLRLRDIQQSFDPAGVLALTAEDMLEIDESFLVATTLRDCTLFLRVSPDGAVEGRLGDLDIKTPQPEKVRYWRETEQKLIDGGWYTRLDVGARAGLCRLERLQAAPTVSG